MTQEKEKCLKSCRLCLQSADGQPNRLKPINREIKKIIKNLFKICVNPNDNLPKAICVNCLQQVETINRFRGNVKRTEKYISKHLNKDDIPKKSLLAKPGTFTTIDEENDEIKVVKNDSNLDNQKNDISDSFQTSISDILKKKASFSPNSVDSKSTIKESPKSRSTKNIHSNTYLKSPGAQNTVVNAVTVDLHNRKSANDSFETKSVDLDNRLDDAYKALAKTPPHSQSASHIAGRGFCFPQNFCSNVLANVTCTTLSKKVSDVNPASSHPKLLHNRSSELGKFFSDDIRQTQGHITSYDLLFDTFRNKETNLVSVDSILSALQSLGIRKNDPRIKGMLESLETKYIESNSAVDSPERMELDKKAFFEVTETTIPFLNKAFGGQFIICEFPLLTKAIEDIYISCKSNIDGTVAKNLTCLTKPITESWGISLCTIDGQRFSIGDTLEPFAIQCCSRPLIYALALETLGSEVVHKYVGTEPSGKNFNELVLDSNMKPSNPMIDAGAMMVCSLLRTLETPEQTLSEKFNGVMSFLSSLAAREPLNFNSAVYFSGKEKADKNFALGFYMKEHKCFPEKTNFAECMDFYFQCCSIEANCELMSLVAATLANGGICPLTEEVVLQPETVRNVLSLMFSSGMEGYSGQFAFSVGLPAKSALPGTIMLVVPNVMGICTWSPSLDSWGNSCRGIQFCHELVEQFNLHKYEAFSKTKKDPRQATVETIGLNIFNLLFSAFKGDLNALKRQRLPGLDMSLADYDGRTALHLAAAEGHLACVEYLVDCGLSPNCRDRWGNTPIDGARTNKRLTVIKFLEDYVANNPDNLKPAFVNDVIVMNATEVSKEKFDIVRSGTYSV